MRSGLSRVGRCGPDARRAPSRAALPPRRQGPPARGWRARVHLRAGRLRREVCAGARRPHTLCLDARARERSPSPSRSSARSSCARMEVTSRMVSRARYGAWRTPPPTPSGAADLTPWSACGTSSSASARPAQRAGPRSPTVRPRYGRSWTSSPLGSWRAPSTPLSAQRPQRLPGGRRAARQPPSSQSAVAWMLDLRAMLGHARMERECAIVARAVERERAIAARAVAAGEAGVARLNGGIHNLHADHELPTCLLSINCMPHQHYVTAQRLPA